MPFKSEAQRRLFHVLERKGKLKKGTTRHWEDETGDRKLPEKVAAGGPPPGVIRPLPPIARAIKPRPPAPKPSLPARAVNAVQTGLWRLGERTGLNADRRALFGVKVDMATEPARRKLEQAAIQGSARIGPHAPMLGDALQYADDAVRMATPHITGAVDALQQLGLHHFLGG